MKIDEILSNTAFIQMNHFNRIVSTYSHEYDNKIQLNKNNTTPPLRNANLIKSHLCLVNAFYLRQPFSSIAERVSKFFVGNLLG